MSKKFFAAAVLMLALSAVSFAGTYARIDLNCKGGTVFKVLNEKLPEGLSVNGKKKNTIFVNLEKVQEFAVELEVVAVGDAESATITPSLTPVRYPKDGEAAVVECALFEVAGEAAAPVPCTVTKWKKMLENNLEVSKGDKLTVKAKLKPAAAE